MASLPFHTPSTPELPCPLSYASQLKPVPPLCQEHHPKAAHPGHQYTLTLLRPVESLRLASLLTVVLDCVILRNNITWAQVWLLMERGQNPEKQGLPRSLPWSTTRIELPNRLGLDSSQLCAVLSFLYQVTRVLLILPQSSLMNSKDFTISVTGQSWLGRGVNASPAIVWGSSASLWGPVPMLCQGLLATGKQISQGAERLQSWFSSRRRRQTGGTELISLLRSQQ